MGDVIIAGWGAVSPAGWSAKNLADVVLDETALPVSEERRAENAPLCRFRKVPEAPLSAPWVKHPRLRRAGPSARFAVGAALEALGGSAGKAETLGVIFVTMTGSVVFSRRFYAEALQNPALASPILFPETVFNAPASHLSAVLESAALNYTLPGDSAQFLRGLDVAVEWLEENRATGCLVVAAEEHDWLTNEALNLFPGCRIASEGAAALLLKRGEAAGAIRIDQITESVSMNAARSRAAAALEMRRCIDANRLGSQPPVLCDSQCGDAARDRAERAAWSGFSGRRFSVTPLLGDSLGVSSGWQCVLACELLSRRIADAAMVSAVGCSDQAIGAVFANS